MKIKVIALFHFFLLAVSGVFILSCKKEIPVTMPELSTIPLKTITPTSALCGGDITSSGGAIIQSRGICWSINEGPTLSDSYTIDGSGPGNFKSTMTGLANGTEYYVRAYATNIAGTAYGNEFVFLTPVTDIDGNVYSTVIIGTQVWTRENLKTTKFNDNAEIPNVSDNSRWISLTTPAFAWYKNDRNSYKDIYGGLYNWFAVNTGRLCPVGWHVPDEDEWTILTDCLGGDDVAGGKLKEEGTIHWNSPNDGAVDLFGFSALPGGYRSGLSPGNTVAIGYLGFWWAGSDYDLTWARGRALTYDAGDMAKGWALKTNGYSVRCIKN